LILYKTDPVGKKYMLSKFFFNYQFSRDYKILGTSHAYDTLGIISRK